MSASLSGSGQMNDWLLPLPGDIVSNDSFAQDLIRQFDQKRSRLHLELTLPEGHRIDHKAAATANGAGKSSAESSQEEQQQQQQQPHRRRRSAGDLLRRSSAYLKSKIEAMRRSQNDDGGSEKEDVPVPGQQPSKLVVHTTIAIPRSNHRPNSFLSHPAVAAAATVQPPVITQYPPKPLKYSPVEPVLAEKPSEKQPRRMHHRISLPALRGHRVSSSSSHAPRRRSDIGVPRKSSRKATDS